MSFTTTSPDNIITIGDANDTIKLNKISPLYTSVPAVFDLSYVGGIVSGTYQNLNTSFRNTVVNICKFDNVPPGNYIVFFNCNVHGVGEYGFVLKLSNLSTVCSDTDCDYHNVTLNYDVRFLFSIPYANNTKQTLYINAYSNNPPNSISMNEFYYGYLMRIG